MARGTTKHGAVAAGHLLTAQAAADVLREGGNAFDAAIAGLWMACAAEPVLASPGGGGFLMARRAGRADAHLFDFFVHTPRRKARLADLEHEEVSVDFGPATQAFHVGAGTSAAPGFVPGLFDIHDKLASLPMTRLAEPAVAAARGGVTVTALQARLAEIVAPILTWTDQARALFAPDGALPQAGQTFRNTDLADAIDAIAREGARIATEGEIAQAMLAAGSGGGSLGKDDLAGYEVTVRDPLTAGYDGRAIFLNPPPSCGGALIADMAARLPERLGRYPDPADMARIIDATDRAWQSTGCDIRAFTGHGDSATVRARGTTHISIIDAHGNAAAASISNGEGNGRVVPGCGFMLNNMLGEEDVNPAGPEDWIENRRLASMMAPTLTLARDGALAALGSGGSNRIRTAVFQMLTRLLAGSGELEDAVAAPRLHVARGHLDFEEIEDEDKREALVRAFEDHRAWAEQSVFFGGVHTVTRDAAGSFQAAGDPRREGAAVIA